MSTADGVDDGCTAIEADLHHANDLLDSSSGLVNGQLSDTSAVSLVDVVAGKAKDVAESIRKGEDCLVVILVLGLELLDEDTFLFWL